MPRLNIIKVDLARWLHRTVEYRGGSAEMLSGTVLCMLSASGRKILPRPLLLNVCLEPWQDFEVAPDLHDRIRANIQLLEARYDGAEVY